MTTKPPPAPRFFYDVRSVISPENPMKEWVTCVGKTRYPGGRRCWNPIARHNIATAERIIRDLSALQYFDQTWKPILRKLAKLLLCTRNHQCQASEMTIEWYLTIQDSIEEAFIMQRCSIESQLEESVVLENARKANEKQQRRIMNEARTEKENKMLEIAKKESEEQQRRIMNEARIEEEKKMLEKELLKAQVVEDARMIFKEEERQRKDRQSCDKVNSILDATREIRQGTYVVVETTLFRRPICLVKNTRQERNDQEPGPRYLDRSTQTSCNVGQPMTLELNRVAGLNSSQRMSLVGLAPAMPFMPTSLILRDRSISGRVVSTTMEYVPRYFYVNRPFAFELAGPTSVLKLTNRSFIPHIWKYLHEAMRTLIPRLNGFAMSGSQKTMKWAMQILLLFQQRYIDLGGTSIYL